MHLRPGLPVLQAGPQRDGREGCQGHARLSDRTHQL